jgi:cyclohexa-1,5-dienecarbonyl-CoA hydratase
MSAGPVTVESRDDGASWRVVLGGTRGNILDAALMAALEDVFLQAARVPRLKAVCLEGHGPNFSFGASVQEHFPEQVGGMLRRFHRLLIALLDSSVVTLAAVRGQCLGGALELVTLCSRIVVSPDARLGQPEIALGVFPPAASVLLTERLGRGAAEDLCLSGRTVDAAEALRIGLVDEIADDPAAAAHAYVSGHLLPRSASSLRLAVKALRMDLRERLVPRLAAVERLYLEQLMTTDDAVEGLHAFVEKRPPAWRDR